MENERVKIKKARILLHDENNEVTELIFPIQLSWTVGDLKVEIEKRISKRIECLFHAGKRANDGDLLNSVSSTTMTFTCPQTNLGFHIVEVGVLQCLQNRGEGFRMSTVFKSLKEVNSSSKGISAKRDSDLGSGGAYFLKLSNNNGRNLISACFKARDDEPGSRNNPTQSQRDGVLPGEAAEREVAAFVLDWGGFCGVPGTLLVESVGPYFGKNQKKIGSFQTFVQNAQDTVGDYSPHLFSPREVHKIGILDLRYLNMDRNDSNILVVQTSIDYHLVPIDHGLCFPDRMEVAWCDWVWWDWPQTLLPFDQETRDWILSIDVEEDIRILKDNFGLRPPCLKIYRCMNIMLRKGVSAGLTLRDIASVVVRSRDLAEPSAMEKTITRATELAFIMESNLRNKSESGERNKLVRSSSFDGNIAMKATNVSDQVFFAYVDRLIEDVIAEILAKKDSSSSTADFDIDGWFSASSRSSPSEITKMASPRLLPMKRRSPQAEAQINTLFAEISGLTLQ